MSQERVPDELTDAQWARRAPLMSGGGKAKRDPRTDNRRFMNAVIWVARSGAKRDYLLRALRTPRHCQAARL